MPDFVAAHTVVIVVSADQNGFGFELRIGTIEQADDVIAGSGPDGTIAEMDGRAGIGKSARLRFQVAINSGLQLKGRGAGGSEDFRRGRVRDDGGWNVEFVVGERL